MRTLLLILFTIPIGSISWIDLSGLLATIALIVYVWRFARATVTKKDMDTALDKKASKSMVKSELEKQNLKISHVEDMSINQDKYIKETLEEHYAILETVQTDIKELLKRK